MNLINQSVEFVNTPNSEQILNTLEKAYRICYASESVGNRDEFIRTKILAGHLSPLEHQIVTVKITTDRGVSHELVRHRLASYSQQSQRYCNYSKNKFGSCITYIRPHWLNSSFIGKVFSEDVFENATLKEKIYIASLLDSETSYLDLLELGIAPQDARGVLPNATATEIIMTMNIREWRHFFKLRAIGTTGLLHPDMKRLACEMLRIFKENIKVVFDDLEVI